MEDDLRRIQTVIGLLKVEIDRLRRQARVHLYAPAVLRELDEQLIVRLLRMQELRQELARFVPQPERWIPETYLPAADRRYVRSRKRSLIVAPGQPTRQP